MASNCKFCGAEVMWVTMRDTGAKNPLEPTPHRDGYIAVAGVTGISLNRADENKERSNGRKLYRSHRQVCKGSRSTSASSHLRNVMEQLGK